MTESSPDKFEEYVQGREKNPEEEEQSSKVSLSFEGPQSCSKFGMRRKEDFTRRKEPNKILISRQSFQF